MNEGAYELLRSREEKMLADLDVEKSFAEKYVLKTQVRMLVEKIVMREVVTVFH